MSHRYSRITGRVRRAYKPNYKHLDRTFDMNLSAKVVYGRQYLPEEFDGDTRQRVYITFNRGVSWQEAFDAAYDMFAVGGCDHEYDCCGCASGGAYHLNRMSKSGRKWTAVLSYSRNY